MRQLSDLSIFKEKEEKDCWETFMFDTAGRYFKKKGEKKKELFLKSHYYLFGCRLLKLCYILNAPLCWNLLVVLFFQHQKYIYR